MGRHIETLKAKRKGAKEHRGGTTVATKRKEGSQRSSQRSAEGRLRGRLPALFPEMMDPPVPPIKDPKDVRLVGGSDAAAVAESELPVISASPASTPPKKVRPRPQSEQLLGRTDRPQGVIASEDGDGKRPFIARRFLSNIFIFIAVISILNAATSDLASLINRLDLQATPDASGFTPGSQFGSSTNRYGTPAKKDDVEKTPSKKSPRESASITSLRPYSRVRDSTATGDSTSNYGPVFSLPNPSAKMDSLPRIFQAPSPVAEEDMEPVFTRAPIVPSTSHSVLKPSDRSRSNLRLKESKSKVNMHKPKNSVSLFS